VDAAAGALVLRSSVYQMFKLITHVSGQPRHRRKPSMPGVRPRLSTALRLVRFACVFVLLIFLVTAGAIGRVSLPRAL
jgi:hypothetical protein